VIPTKVYLRNDYTKVLQLTILTGLSHLPSSLLDTTTIDTSAITTTAAAAIAVAISMVTVTDQYNSHDDFSTNTSSSMNKL
jgi:hypothetical protein